MGSDQLPQSIVLLAWMIGGGGISAIAVALIGKRRAQREEAPPPPQQSMPVEVNSPWLVQNILEMKMTAEANERDLAAMIKVMGDLVIQVNSIAALLKRRRKRSRRIAGSGS